ncbi:hypothetical protein [Streptomyces griseocarneus]|uniref:hypothetical protein n=1 Tax=Streptomyces griseocarneus TaxID=51201 RepID=UPI00167C84A0|nr:hypothetical protein [Streptomyces griseocarneus]MBZ6477828.1 hypothetical protein [Streptomyces griseocarneus]GHG58153.1 hypothetical protein GCM10018779_23480 [Streptomyces griseocarneus]
MPPNKSLEDLPSDMPAARREFAEAMRGIRSCLDLSQRGIATAVQSNKTTVNECLNARKVSRGDIDVIKRIYDLAAQSAQHAALPVTWDKLVLLFEELWKEEERLAPRSPIAVPHTSKKERQPRAVATPPVRRRLTRVRNGRSHQRAAIRRARQATAHVGASAATTDLEASTASAVAPVPSRQGDRPHENNSERLTEMSWPGLQEVAVHLDRGRTLDAVTILRNAGWALPVEEVPGAISDCRAAGLDDAAETMLSSAGQRDINAVLYLATTFNNEHRHDDVGALLRSASRARA